VYIPEEVYPVCLQGLRTLAVGSKVLEEEAWAEWDTRYQVFKYKTKLIIIKDQLNRSNVHSHPILSIFPEF
jgi:hypothetical protein